jgi:hypothetical protein
MTIERDGFEKEGTELPAEGIYLLRITRCEEKESRAGNKMFVLDYLLIDEEGGDLGFREVRFEHLTFPKILMPGEQYKNLKVEARKKKLSETDFARYTLQKNELHKFQWRVEQFEHALELKRPYDALDLIGKVAAASIVLEPDLEGLPRVKVKTWINPKELKTQNKEQGFGAAGEEADFAQESVQESSQEALQEPAQKAAPVPPAEAPVTEPAPSEKPKTLADIGW